MSAATFTLRTLLILVTVAAVGCYALTQHTPIWANITVTMCCGLLMLAGLLAFIRRGASRAYWAGFAVTGWAYLLAAFSPFLFGGSPALLTTKSLFVGWDYVGVAAPPSDPTSGASSILQDSDLGDLEDHYFEIMMRLRSGFYAPGQQEYRNAVRAYLTIGQALWALILGFAAGLLAAVLCWRQRRWDEAAASA
jgi:hypothetical protein